MLTLLRHAQSLCNLQRYTALIPALQVKNESLFRNWQFMLNFLIAHLQILVRYKTKGAVRALGALMRNWQLSA